MSDPVNGQQHTAEEVEEEFVVNDHDDVGEEGEEDDVYEVEEDAEVCPLSLSLPFSSVLHPPSSLWALLLRWLCWAYYIRRTLT